MEMDGPRLMGLGCCRTVAVLLQHCCGTSAALLQRTWASAAPSMPLWLHGGGGERGGGGADSIWYSRVLLIF
jgi:hypothetical protein